MIDHARQVLKDNDRGTYTVPTHGLYPFQWNWDSALSAHGFAQFDAPRAWTEIETLAESCAYLIPSHARNDPEFDGLRYWRGPVWLMVNYMVADGLERAGERQMVGRIMGDCLRLIEISGFAEYHDPITAEPCGGAHFTWTAAMVIEILNTFEVDA